MSSTEAEYCAFTDVAKDIIWIKRMAEFFNEPFPEPALLKNDNITAQNIATGEATLNSVNKYKDSSINNGDNVLEIP